MVDPVGLEGTVDGPVYRLAPRRGSHGVVEPSTGGDVVFPNINRSDVDRRYADGDTVVTRVGGTVPSGHDLLCVVHPDGTLVPATGEQAVTPEPADTLVLLGRAVG